MLLLLQHHGRQTARTLAETLEVSERTVLRDVEALSEAGVPIYTVRGGRGGIELLDGFRTRLTGFTPEEASCLHLVGQPQVAHRLGLAAPTRTARNKLLGALTPHQAGEADHLATWFVHDPDPWTGHRVPHGELRRLVRCIEEHREVELAFADPPPGVACPLGLVLKAGAWHLVHVPVPGDRVEVRCLDDLRATRITDRRFGPPRDFDLTGFWERYTAGRDSPGAVTRSLA